MALATDANICKLQQMFPKVEGDVIAILLNDCENNVEKCINQLLSLCDDASPVRHHTSHTHNDAGRAHKTGPGHSPHSTHSISPRKIGDRGPLKEVHVCNSPKRKLQGKFKDARPPVNSVRSQYPPGGHGNKVHVHVRPPQGRGGNHGVRPHPPPQDNHYWTPEPRGGRGSHHNPYHPRGGGASRRPALLASPFPPPGPRGLIRPPGNIHHRPPQRPPPNWQYYPNGCPRPPMWQEPIPPPQQCGLPNNDSSNIQPQIIVAGDMQMRPGSVPVPYSNPMAHGGMARLPGGVPGPHGGGSAFPPPRGKTHATGVNSQSKGLLSPIQGPTVSVHGPVAESHTPIRPDHRRTVNNDDQEKVGWPIDTESEFRTEYGNATEPYTTETGTGDKQNGTEQESAMELAGKEWLQWVEESSATEKRLMILRGLPGSGKSTLARELAGKDGIIFSTDDLFYINGRYVFDRSKLGEYHERNRENARQAMLIEISPVVIDNTNTTAWEMKPYVELAQSLGYEVAILEPSTPWKFDCAELARRNSHGVPHDKIERMLERYEHHITVESILASQPPNKDRAPHGSSRRGNNRDSGRNGSTTPALPHSYHKQQVSSSNPQKRPSSNFPRTARPILSTPSAPSENYHSDPFSLTPRSPSLLPRSTNSISSSPATPLSLLQTADSAVQWDRDKPTPSSTPSPSSSLLPPPQQGSSNLTLGEKQSSSLMNHSTHSSTISLGSREATDTMKGNAAMIKPTLPLPATSHAPTTSHLSAPSKPSGTAADPLSLPLRNLTKMEEEERAAKMSLIWGDGRLSDDSESLSRPESGSIGWSGREVWSGEGGGLPLASLGKDVVNMNWDKLPSSGNGTVWNSLDPVGGGVVDQENSLVGLPCEFGPIGRPTKQTSVANTVDNSGIISQVKVDKTNTEASVMPAAITSMENGFLPHVKSPLTPKTSKPSQESVKSPQKVMNVTTPSKNGSSSAELWVSEEVENWTYEAASDSMFVEGRKGESDGVSSTGTSIHSSATSEPPQRVNEEKSGGAKGGGSVDPSNYDQLGPAEIMSDSSFEDPAIVNMVKQSLSPKELLTDTVASGHETANFLTTFDGWKDLDLDPESQEPLFAVPSSETSPETKQHGSTPTLSSSSSVSLLLPHLPPGTRATVATAAPETVQCSTPTLIPRDEDDGLIAECLGGEGRGKDFFPSAFESEGDPFLSEVPIEEGDRVPRTDTSLNYNAKQVNLSNENSSSILANCVSGTAESDQLKAKRTLWPLMLEAEEATRENDRDEECVVPLGTLASNVGESSVYHDRHQPLPPPSARGNATQLCEGLLNGGEGGVGEVPDPESDLAFLVECFPDLSQQFLRLLLQQNHGNVEEAVSTALVSTVTSPTLPRDIGNIFSLTSSPLAYDHVHQQVQGGRLHQHASESSAVSVTSESEVEGGVEFVISEDDECVDDKEIARIMQEQLNRVDSGDSSLQAARRIAMQGTERRGEGGERGQVDETLLGEVQEDDNLVLRLSRSLASQLQQMFGSVEKHLSMEGPLRDDDLQVLLSERAAHQIWQKWVDTLEAKKVEIQLHQDTVISRAQSAPVIQPAHDSVPVARSGTVASSLAHIMDQQTAQQTSAQEMSNMVKTVCNGTVAQRVQLQSLYKRFRSLDKEMIHSVLIRNNFNFSSATQELEKKAAAREDTPDAPSQSTQSSFAHTAKKPVKQGREPGQPVASAARKRKTRSKTGQMSQLRRDEEAVVKPFQEIEEQPSYDDLRAEAALHAKLRSEAFQKAAHARSLRQGEVAFFYAQQGHSHTEKMKEANMRAADLILKLQNDVSSQTLDLHGLHVEEAISALQEKLHSTTDSVLHVITGKGIHSKGEARIKPAVVQFLTNKNYTFEEQPGRVKVTLSTY